MSRSVTGTFLILLGCVFLLVNLGYISWDVVEELVKLWPLLLVAWGISLITRGTKVAFLGVFGPLLLVAALLLVLWNTHLGAAGDLTSVAVEQDLTDIDAAKVTVRFAGGKLNVRSGEPSILLKADLDYRADSETPTLEYYEDEGEGYATLRRRGKTSAGPGLGNRWEVALSNRIPIRMKLVSEGGTCSLDLAELQIVDLDLNAAASSMEVRLGEGDSDCSVTLDAGVSDVKLEVPRRYGIKLRLSCGLCWKDLPSGMSKRSGGGRVYYSENYDQAAQVMDIRVEAGLSRFKIERY